MSGHQEYKCPKCGCEWETLDAPNCPRCSSFAAPPGSAAYVAADCLREEVRRFKQTNRFTPMEVTGFYLQAAVVLDEHEVMMRALREILDYGCDGNIAAIARLALPPNGRDERPGPADGSGDADPKCANCGHPKSWHTNGKFYCPDPCGCTYFRRTVYAKRRLPNE